MLTKIFFHILVINIRWEFAEIEFAKKNSHFFHLWAQSLTNYFKGFYTIFCGSLKYPKNDFFQNTIFSIKRFEGSKKH